MHYPISQLDEQEQYWIKQYADNGYQLRNKTSGSQGEGKAKIDDYRPQKGYYDGLKQGRHNLAKELSHIIDTHLVVSVRPEKQGKQSEKLSTINITDTVHTAVVRYPLKVLT